MAEDKQPAHRECQTSDRQASDQCGEPVERGRAVPVRSYDDRRDSIARIDRVRDEAAVGSPGDDRCRQWRAWCEAVTSIVGSCHGHGFGRVNVGAVGNNPPVRSLRDARGPLAGRVVCTRAHACVDERDAHAENERNAKHVKLLRLWPLGAADQDTVACSRRNAGNGGCKAAARRLKPLQLSLYGRADRDSFIE